MAKALIDPLGPITLEQSRASAATRGTLSLVAGIALLLVAVAALVMMFQPQPETSGLHVLSAGALGLGAIGFGLSQIKLSKQENRVHFHADLAGIQGLVVGTSGIVPWASVANIDGGFGEVNVKLIDGQTVHIREGFVGMAKGLQGLPSSKKIAERLEVLRAASLSKA